MSNTKLGKGTKGSKFWIQEYINTSRVAELDNGIKNIFKHINKITWVSPLVEDNYREIKPKEVSILKGVDYSFWPSNGPWWDAIGVANDDEIILIEAKGHIKELKSKCTASSHKSIRQIKNSLEAAHTHLGTNEYDEDLWFNKFYQYGNRLAWYYNLKKQDVKVTLIFIDFVNDFTHISTTIERWKAKNKVLENLMLGELKNNEFISHIYLDVNSK